MWNCKQYKVSSGIYYISDGIYYISVALYRFQGRWYVLTWYFDNIII